MILVFRSSMRKVGSVRLGFSGFECFASLLGVLRGLWPMVRMRDVRYSEFTLKNNVRECIGPPIECRAGLDTKRFAGVLSCVNRSRNTYGL